MAKLYLQKDITISIEGVENEEVSLTNTSIPTPTVESEITNIPPEITSTPSMVAQSPPIIPTATIEDPLVIQTPTITPTLSASINHQNIEMVLIPEGLFTMGTDPEVELERCKAFYPPGGSCQLNLYDDEDPEHMVMLSNYYIDIYEVTNEAYKRCELEGGCTPPYEISSPGVDFYYGNEKYNNYPVVHVDWNQASTYCEWRGARLPTEAEWEKAARGEDKRRYPWGIEKPEEYLLNFNLNTSGTGPVGNYPDTKSPFGTYDMAGNVSEWVSDTYADYPSDLQTDPTGPEFGTRKVLRGGGWKSSGEHVRTTNREWAESEFGNEAYFHDVGFRCALTP